MSDFDLIVDSSDVVQAGKDLLKMGQDSESMAKSAQSSASVFVASFNNIEKQLGLVEKANTDFARASQVTYNSLLKVDGATKSAQASASVFKSSIIEQEKETKRLNLEQNKQAVLVERLAAKYKPLYAASKQYERALKEIKQAGALGVISNQQMENSVESLTQEFQQFQNGAAGWSNQFETGATRGARSMSKMGVVTQQVGYQVGDFAVQVQGGQSILVAFSQQATQLVGVLPLMADKLKITQGAAIALSAGLGIGIPIVTALAGVLFTVVKGGIDAANSVKAFDERLESARESVTTMTEDLRLMNSEFEHTTELALNDAVIVAQEKLAEALERQSTARGQATRGASSNVDNAREALRLAEEELASAVELRDTHEQTSNLQQGSNEAIKDFLQLVEDRNALQQEHWRVARETLEVQQEANDMKALEVEYGENSLEVLQAQHNAQSAILEQKIIEERLSNELANSLREALSVAQAFETVDMGFAIRQAKLDTDALISRLNVAVITAAAVGGGAYSGRGSSPGAGSSSADRFILGSGGQNVSDDERALAAIREANSSSSRSRGSSRSGGSSRAAKVERDDFIESLEKEMVQREALLKLSGEQRDLQEEIFRIEGGLGEARSEYSSVQIEAIANANLLLQEQEELYQNSIDNMQNIFDNIEGSMGEAFTSILDGTESVKDAFRSMAKDVIDQLLQIIIQQRIVGSFDVGSGTGTGIVGSIGGALFGGFRAEGGDVSAGKAYVVGEKEAEVFVPNTSGTIYNQQQLAAMGNGGSSQRVELVVTAADGVSIQTVRDEVGVQIKQSAPAIVSSSVKASQQSMKTGPKGNWSI